MAGHNILEVLSFEVEVGGDAKEDFVGSLIQKVEEVLVKPGSRWSLLRQVSFKVKVLQTKDCAKLCEALQSLPDKYLSDLLKFESVVDIL